MRRTSTIALLAWAFVTGVAAPSARASEPESVGDALVPPAHVQADPGQAVEGAATATAQESPDESSLAEVLTWRKSDKTWLRLRGWVALDLRAFPRTEKGHGKSWNVEPFLSSARVSARFLWRGSWGGRVDVEVSEANPDLQEAWFEYRPFEVFGIRAGRFKVPFGAAPQVETPNQRVLAAPMLFGNPKDFRDVGLMVCGDWSDGYLGYAVSVGSGSRDIRVDVNERPDFTARLILHPPRGISPWLSGLRAAVSAGWGEGPERQGFRGRTLGGHSFFSPPSVRGQQWRVGGDLEYATPWFRVAGEYAWTRQEREGLTTYALVGTTPTDVGSLAPLVVRGGSVEASFIPFGERDESFVPSSGIELVGRFEHVQFGDGTRQVATAAGVEDRAPLADATVMGIAAGVHGYMRPGIRLSLVWQGLRFSDAAMAPDHEGTRTGSAWFHQVFFRAQWSI